MDDMMAAPAPAADDANMMGFTDAAPAAEAAAPVDPMSLMADAGGSPPQAAPASYEDPFQGVPTKDTPAMGAVSMGIPEMNALREWEHKHERELEEIVKKEESEKKDKKTAATEELAKWHAESAATIKKRFSTNRADEKSSEAARAETQKPGANPWERVVDLIDTNARPADDASDTSRMRSLLIQLKSNPITAAA
uniref:Clathrin light chain n=1 Tax=Strombidinopsis acuminata TaxID=141414 RepID=A0A7S3SYN8_9SPIT|mmetsp:Transcript_48470/g.65819  ORF Transcript_48470/g.65819 Transcript_48470/m.65819 type:complete len:195 (+) Transcript_48470:69-653(+)